MICCAAASPFQVYLLSTYLSSNPTKEKIILLYRKAKNDTEIDSSMFNLLEDTGCRIIKISSPMCLIVFSFVSFFNCFFSKFIVCDFKSIYFHILIRKLSRKNVFFLDDGASSFYLLDLIRRDGYLPFLNGVKNLNCFKKYFFKALGVELENLSMSGYNYYTIFNVTGEDRNKNIFPLNFTHRGNNLIVDGSYYLGGKYVDLDIIDIDDYCKSIKRALELTTGILYYIPHRNESDDILKMVSSIADISILKINKPVEMWFLTEGIHPKQIFSVYSTALFTTKKIFPDCEVYATSIDLKKVPIIYRDNVSCVYEQFLDYKINFV